jgi:hypothetical protein
VADRPRPPLGPLVATDDHESHDALLIAAYTAGDLEEDDLQRAVTLIARCDECSTLAADLGAIASAAASLPAARRPRDFTITPEQAAALRKGGWRRFLSGLTSPRSVLAPRLAGALTTLGVAGLLLASLPGMTPQAGGEVQVMGQPTDRNAIVQEASPAPHPAPQEGQAPPGEHGQEPGFVDDGTGTRSDTAGEPKSGELVRPEAAGPEAAGQDRLLLIALSSALLAAGLGIFALRRTGGGRTSRWVGR